MARSGGSVDPSPVTAVYSATVTSYLPNQKPWVIVTRCCNSSLSRPSSPCGLPIRKLPGGTHTSLAGLGLAGTLGVPFARTTRNPTVSFLSVGRCASRLAERQSAAPAIQLPPRTTRIVPLVGPRGSNNRSAERDPYQSKHHSA